MTMENLITWIFYNLFNKSLLLNMYYVSNFWYYKQHYNKLPIFHI